MRRVLGAALAGVLVLGGCSAQSSEAQLVDAYDALVAQANAGNAAGLTAAVDAFVEVVHRQEGAELTTTEARGLTALAQRVKASAGLVGAADPTTAPPTVAPDDGKAAEEARKRQEEELKRQEEERKKLEEEARKRQEEERKRQEEERKEQEEQEERDEPQPTVEATVAPAGDGATPAPSGGAVRRTSPSPSPEPSA